MYKINKSVEIVTTTIKSLSSMGRVSRIGAKEVLEKRYSNVRITDVRTVEDLEGVVARRPDLVFLGMKFVLDNTSPQPRRVWLAERFARAGIAYTGSDGAASMLEHDKLSSKSRIKTSGLKTADSQLIRRNEPYTEADINLPYPIFIKPVDGGGGSGINENSLVRNFSALKEQVSWLMDRCKTDALLETYLPGREFSVGVLRRRLSSGFSLLPLEIIAPVNQLGERFLSSRVKQEDSEKTLEVTDLGLRRKINQLAYESFIALGAEDYGRIDIRLDESGEPYFLEANLLPSLLNNYGNLPKAALLNIGLSHKELILKIASLGLTKSSEVISDHLDYQTSEEAYGLMGLATKAAL